MYPSQTLGKIVMGRLEASRTRVVKKFEKGERRGTMGRSGFWGCHILAQPFYAPVENVLHTCDGCIEPDEVSLTGFTYIKQFARDDAKLRKLIDQVFAVLRL
jgi:hypothetical protein